MPKDEKDITIREKVNIALEKELFGKDTISLFVLKKSERLASALYLVTDFLPQDEPLRRVIRDRGVNLLSDMVRWCGHEAQPHDSVLLLRDRVIELVGFLRVAATAGYLSEMNRDVLIKEYYGILQFMMDNNTGIPTKGKMLSDDFFSHPSPVSGGGSGYAPSEKDTSSRYKGHDEVYKGHYGNQIKDTSPTEYSTARDLKGHGGVSQRQLDTLKRHTARRSAIIELVQRKGQVTMKDVSLVISGCSEKTLQRELFVLVEEGVLKKEGKRRWSTYMLAR